MTKNLQAVLINYTTLGLFVRYVGGINIPGCPFFHLQPLHNLRVIARVSTRYGTCKNGIPYP